MVRFETIMTSNPDRFQEYDPEALSQISQWFGHYRPDHFDQNALEDLRRRLSRRGISLYTFQQDYLPILYELLQDSIETGHLKSLPPLFSYEVEPASFAQWAPLWMEEFAQQNAPQTVARYRLVLERDLLPCFRDQDLCALDGREVAEYEQNYLSQGRSKSCFQYQSRILYLTLDHYVAQKIQEDTELAEALEACDTSYLYVKDVAVQWSRQSSNLSQEDQKILSNYILPLLGLSNLKAYNPRRMARYRRELARRGLGEPVFQRHLVLLNQIKDFAEHSGLLAEKPALENPKRGRFSNPHTVGEAEREKILLIPDNDRGGLILRLALEMGLRNEEIRTLRWSDIHLDTSSAEVDGRCIPIPENFCQKLRRLAGGSGKTGYVILNTATESGPISMPALYRSARKTFLRYGLRDLRLYDLRSSYIINLLQKMPVENVAEQCGYSNVEELQMRYGAYLPCH